ncbi:cache domain-containing protein [Desulfogranum marinum]|uniref:cache domain-containing protein n=1 Tax=Desulfogranum marinum TaxID=453220 RepID=UPI001963BB8E|nr:HD domain-containing phosphohydrolase [Desulfogranum marinum]MBM9512688.1 cache domain-containing protein [Desulfogranum marinum]
MENKGMQQLSRAISLRIALPALLTILLFIVSIFLVILPSLEKNFMAGKREMIKELVETTWNVLATYHSKEQEGILTREEAQLQAIDIIRHFRYGNNAMNYFWINDLDHRLVVHPYRSDMEGDDSTSFKDPTGKRIFIEFVQIAQQQGAGYVEYMWQWLDEPEKISPKLSYVKLFKPWGWVLGTGVYLEEVQAQIAKIRKRLTAVSTLFLVAAILLALYSIRHTILADRVRVRIWEERRRLIKDIEKSKERYRSLVETTSDWIWEISHTGYFTYSSPNVRNILGYKAEKILGKTLTDLCIPQEKQHIETTFQELLVKEKPFYGFEVPCLTEERKKVVIEFNAIPICDISDKEGFTVFRGVARDVTERKAVMQQLKNSTKRLRSSLEETVKSLASAAEKRDPYTAGHQLRVDELACAIARELKLSDDRLEGLHFAAILHDIGKISVPAEYLAKPTALSAQERAVIKCHPEVGYKILKNIQFPWPVAQIVYQHHELLDGSGYPRGLKDGEILLEAKILTVADVVEAISSHRPYRPSLGIETALDEIRAGRGLKYHTASVDACIRLITQNIVELSSQTW